MKQAEGNRFIVGNFSLKEAGLQRQLAHAVRNGDDELARTTREELDKLSRYQASVRKRESKKFKKADLINRRNFDDNTNGLNRATAKFQASMRAGAGEDDPFARRPTRPGNLWDVDGDTKVAEQASTSENQKDTSNGGAEKMSNTNTKVAASKLEKGTEVMSYSVTHRLHLVHDFDIDLTVRAPATRSIVRAKPVQHRHAGMTLREYLAKY